MYDEILEMNPGRYCRSGFMTRILLLHHKLIKCLSICTCIAASTISHAFVLELFMISFTWVPDSVVWHAEWSTENSPPGSAELAPALDHISGMLPWYVFLCLKQYKAEETCSKKKIVLRHMKLRKKLIKKAWKYSFQFLVWRPLYLIIDFIQLYKHCSILLFKWLRVLQRVIAVNLIYGHVVVHAPQL